MKRTSFAKDACPVARSVGAVGDWWSLLIVRDAFVGNKLSHPASMRASARIGKPERKVRSS